MSEPTDGPDMGIAMGTRSPQEWRELFERHGVDAKGCSVRLKDAYSVEVRPSRGVCVM